MSVGWLTVAFGDVMKPNRRPYTLGPTEDANLVGMRLYGAGPFHRELKPGIRIAKKSHFVIRAGDVIYNKLFAWKGTFGIVPPELDGMLVSDKFPTYELDQGKVDSGYLQWFFRCPVVWEQARVRSTGSAALSKLTLNPPKFLELTIPLPSLREQQRIVARIDAMARKMEEAKTLRRHADVEMSTLMQRIVAAFVTPSQPGWQQRTVADLVLGMDAGWSPQCEDSPAKDGEWGVLKTTSVQWCEFLPEHNKALPPGLVPRPELAVRAGDVLVTRAGPLKRVGVVAAVRENALCLTISDKLIRLRPNLSLVHPQFLELSLASPTSQEYLVTRKTGLADAQVNISQAILRSTPVAFPPLAKQMWIVAAVESVKKRLQDLRNEQTDVGREVDALLPAILDRAFKGEL